jgi:outer membrane biosynthesis protein TonB
MSRDDFANDPEQPPASAYPGGNAPWNSGPDAPINYSPPLGQGGGTPPNTNPYTGAPSGGGGGPPASTPPAAAPPASTTDGYGPNAIKFALGADGKYHAYGTRQVISSDPNKPGFSKYTEETVDLGTTDNMAGIAAASGIPEALLGVLFKEQSKQINQQGNAVLRNKNPDGTYSVTMPDGTIQNQTLQQLAGLSSISAGDIAQADRDFAYSSMRAKEANWVAGGVQLYNGGAGPGVQMPTMQPASAQAPPGPAPMPQPNPYTPPPQPGVTPSPNPMWGAAPAPAQTPQQPAPNPSPYGGTLGGGAVTTQAQGANVATSMLPMQRATGAGGDTASTAGGTAGSSAYSTGTGNYGNSNGSWQDYELGTRGLQNQYERGNYTFQMGTPTYGQNGETRQQFTQRVNDLQNQYNMSKATFDLSHQGQQQANEGQQLAVQANKNQQMGQGRTIYGGGLGSLNPMRVAGLS